MSVNHILRVSLPVSDQEAAKAFYVDALGLDLKGEWPVPMGENSRWIEVAPKGGQTSFILANWLEMKPGSVQGIMLEVSDMGAQVARLSKAGVAVDGPKTTPWGVQATFTDPDGNGFVLSAPTPDGWQ